MYSDILHRPYISFFAFLFREEIWGIDAGFIFLFDPSVLFLCVFFWGGWSFHLGGLSDDKEEESDQKQGHEHKDGGKEDDGNDGEATGKNDRGTDVKGKMPAAAAGEDEKEDDVNVNADEKQEIFLFFLSTKAGGQVRRCRCFSREGEGERGAGMFFD